MDIFLSQSKGRAIAGILAFAGCLAMVMLPEEAILSAQKAIALWANSVLPALLPFFICANFMSYLGVINKLPPAIFTFSMSIMSGYPVGAKIVGDMRRKGDISIKDGKRLISFCSTSGPSFMLGAIGIGMLGSVKAGIIIAVCHYIGALINGAIFALPGGKIHVKKSIQKSKAGDVLDLLTDSIMDALKALGIILAYIVIFMFITDILQLIGAFNFISNTYVRIFIKGIFEMTVGCSAMIYAEIVLAAKIIICTMLISFGGISIIGQSLSMLSRSGISAKYFIWTKVCHTFWSGVVAAAVVCIFL